MPKSKNSVDAENDAYVGVDAQYQNHAYPVDEPMLAEDDDGVEAALVERAQATEAANTIDPERVPNPHLGFEPITPHPTEATKPTDEYIAGNRAMAQAMAESAAERNAEKAAAAEGDTPSDEPSTGTPPLGS